MRYKWIIGESIFTRKFKKIWSNGGEANRPSSDDCSGWYRPNRIRFHEMTKSKKDDLKGTNGI